MYWFAICSAMSAGDLFLLDALLDLTRTRAGWPLEKFVRDLMNDRNQEDQVFLTSRIEAFVSRVELTNPTFQHGRASFSPA